MRVSARPPRRLNDKSITFLKCSHASKLTRESIGRDVVYSECSELPLGRSCDVVYSECSELPLGRSCDLVYSECSELPLGRSCDVVYSECSELPLGRSCDEYC